MRKILYALFLIICTSGMAYAGPGDTTWVQAQNNIQLTAYGSFDAPVAFPAGTATYRKIYLVFTLGEYNCPGSPQYCHQWDYDVHSILMTPGGDTMELARFITPYGNTGVPRFSTSWTYRYITDVTDYYPLLKNNAALRIFYSGYSYGFTADVKFAFIEGTPERNVLGIRKLWNGGYQYGNATNPIDNKITAVSNVAPVGTAYSELKFTVTGHGSDANGCCEFASHNYLVKVNGNTVGAKAIWRADCGYNEIYPQGGTWIYDRANWCPGALVHTNSHSLGITAGISYLVDVDFDAYTVGSNFGSYNVSGNLIYYAVENKAKDASMEDIVAPSDFEGHFRENPSDGRPIIKIRNSGGTGISSIRIKYGVKDSAAAFYDWTGTLAPREETEIMLPELNSLKNMSLNAVAGTFQFAAQVVSVNGSADNDAMNDTLRSFFTVAPTWPNTFVVNMKTNSAGVSGVGQNPGETSWKITDAADNIVASRTNADVTTVYSDTISLPKSGFYKLTVTDVGCDGLHWWVYDQQPGLGITAGSFTIRDYGTGLSIPLHGNTYSGSYNNDFGCGFSQNFTTMGFPAGVSNVPNSAHSSIVAYPNPARNTVSVGLYGLGRISGEISVVDAIGKVVLVQKIASATGVLNVENLASGIYNVVYSDGSAVKISTRITISK